LTETPETPENENRPDEEAVVPTDAAAGAPQEETPAEDETTRAATSAEPTAESPAEEVAAADEAPGPEAAQEPGDAGEEATRVAQSQSEVPSETAPVASSAGPSGESATTEESEAEEEYEPAPRVKPEIPGADLEPVFVPQEEQYLDAEAQAAAEAEAEAAAERARAEAEDEQSKPIAHAAIDLAAGARYTATGKRKTAVARVIIKPGGGEYSINGKALEEFFPRETLQRMIRQPLETVGYESRMDVIARMHGGGVAAQAGALRHGISRALIVADPNLRGELKRRGYLTRDPRVKERKKAGLKKARKRPQFSKR
jgi:small subunit ribosomal protein S9